MPTFIPNLPKHINQQYIQNGTLTIASEAKQSAMAPSQIMNVPQPFIRDSSF